MIIRTIGAIHTEGIYEYSAEGMHNWYVQNFYLNNNWPVCTSLSDGNLFVCGGEDVDFSCIVMPDNHKRRIAKMNTLRQCSAIVKVEHRIYIFGGEKRTRNWWRNRESYLEFADDVEYYDLICDRWVNVASLPQSRNMCGAAYYKGGIFLGGGYCENE